MTEFVVLMWQERVRSGLGLHSRGFPVQRWWVRRLVLWEPVIWKERLSTLLKLESDGFSTNEREKIADPHHFAVLVARK